MADQDQVPTKPPTMLQDATGATSSMRVVMFLWFLLLLAGVGYIVAMTKSFPDIPSSLVQITLFVLGGKVGQAFAERGN